jgi:hypothetical protein
MPTTFANTIDGNDIYAKRAECDAAGNTLSTTYATKSELPTVPSAGNMLSVTSNTLNVTTTAGITDIQQVSALPAQPVATVLYLIPET